MTRPPNLPGTGWATNASRRTVLSSAQWGTGFVAGQPVTAKDINDPIGQLSDWVEYLQVMSPAEGVWTVVVGATTYGTLGYSTTSGSWLRLQANSARDGVIVEALDTVAANTVQFRIDSTNAEATVRGDPTGADTIWLKIKATGLVGPTATASASTGIRWGFPSSSKQEVQHALGPELGGYTPIRPIGVTGVGPIMEFTASPRDCRLANAASAGSHDLVFRRPLLINLPTGQLSGFPVCVEFGATFSGAADDLYCRIWGVNRSTGAETALTGIIKSSTPTASGTYTMDPSTEDYFVEIYSSGAVAAGSTTTDTVRAVYAIVDWQALVPVM